MILATRGLHPRDVRHKVSAFGIFRYKGGEAWLGPAGREAEPRARSQEWGPWEITLEDELISAHGWRVRRGRFWPGEWTRGRVSGEGLVCAEDDDEEGKACKHEMLFLKPKKE